MQRIDGSQFETGTIVTAAWLNAVQEELAGVIEGFGGTLDPNNPNQLLEVLMTLNSTQVGQTIESLGNPGENFRPMGSTLLRSSFPELDAVMPSPSHDSISGTMGSITAALWRKVVDASGAAYVAVSGSVATPLGRTVDGANWTYPALGGISNPVLNDAHVVGGLIVAVGYYGVGAPYKALILTSADNGVTWTQRAVNTFTTQLASVHHDGTNWVAGAMSDAHVYTSPDGINWTQRAFPITPGNLKVRSIGAVLVALDTTQALNNYWAQCYFYVSADHGVTWAVWGISGGGNAIGTVYPNLSASPDWLILQVGSNFYKSADGTTWTLIDPSISVNTILGRAKIMPAAVHYAAGRYLSLGSSDLTDGSGNKLKLDVLLVSPDLEYWYGIQLKSLPDQILFAGRDNFVLGLSYNKTIYTTLTFDPARVVLNLPEANKFVRVK